MLNLSVFELILTARKNKIEKFRISKHTEHKLERQTFCLTNFSTKTVCKDTESPGAWRADFVLVGLQVSNPVRVHTSPGGDLGQFETLETV